MHCEKIFTDHKRSLGQGHIFTPVCDSVHRGVVSSPLHVGIHTSPGIQPPGRHHPGRHPPGQTSPWADAPRMLQDMVNKRAVRILLKCIIVKNWDTKRLLKKIYMWLFFFFSCNGKLILRTVLLWYIDLQFIVGELSWLIDHVLGFLVHTLFLVALVLCKSDWPPETSVILANWSFYHT